MDFKVVAALCVISISIVCLLMVGARVWIRANSWPSLKARLGSAVLSHPQLFHQTYRRLSDFLATLRRGVTNDPLLLSTSHAKAKFGDLVTLIIIYVVAGLILVGAVAFIGEQTDSLKGDNEKLAATDVAEEIVLRNQEDVLKELSADDNAPELVRPSNNEQLIGDHTEFEWKYSHHNDSAEYLLQLVYVQASVGASGQEEIQQADLSSRDETPTPPRPDSQHAWLISGRPCTVAVSDPTNRRARFPRFPDETNVLPEGTYIWRVAFGSLVANPETDGDCVDDQENRNWSAYRSFTLYASRQQRIGATHKLLVGTTFSQNQSFSRIGSGGLPEGFDLDLTKFIVGCLGADASGRVTYDFNLCAATSRRNSSNSSIDNLSPLTLEIVPITSRNQAMNALQDKEVDLYIGAYTKAAARETDEVKFTRGYVTYRTDVLVPKGEQCQTLRCLDDKRTPIGVVQGSSGSQLADDVINYDRLTGIQLTSYPTFPDLDRAFQEGLVSAVIVDGIMREQMGVSGLKTLSDLQRSKGWRMYLRTFIGGKREEFGIAVGSESTDKAGGDNLLRQVDVALNAQATKQQMTQLFQRYRLKSLGACLVDRDDLSITGSDACNSIDSGQEAGRIAHAVAAQQPVRHQPDARASRD